MVLVFNIPDVLNVVTVEGGRAVLDLSLSRDREVDCKNHLRLVVYVAAVVSCDMRWSTLHSREFSNQNLLESLGS